MPNVTRDETLRDPVLLTFYRLARFDTIKACAAFHGVSERAWLYYESGRQAPKVDQANIIIAWMMHDDAAPDASDVASTNNTASP